MSSLLYFKRSAAFHEEGTPFEPVSEKKTLRNPDMKRMLLVMALMLAIGCQKAEETTTTVTIDTTTVQSTPSDNTVGSSSSNAGDTTTSPPGKPTAISGNITIQSPQSNEYVTAERFLIKGLARTFENNVVYRVTDLASGQVIAQGYTTAMGEMGQFNPFTLSVTPQTMNKVQYPTRALIEVFEHSAKDGSEINMAKVQVRMGMGAERQNAILVFFPNPKRGSDIDCGLVFSVPRPMPQTQSPAKLALNFLLAGPMGQEFGQGYETQIPEGVTLKSLTIESGTARADFSAPPNAVAGSCRSLAVRAQIERTLKQFATVENVVITVNGKADQWQP